MIMKLYSCNKYILMQNSKLEEEEKSYTGNAFDQLVKEEWKS